MEALNRDTATFRLAGEGKLYEPYTISLHLTDLCNSYCLFCGEDSHNHSADTVRTEDILRFLEDHKNGKWTAVNIHGGEPTIRKDFIAIVEAIREMNYGKIILQTNAIRMSNKEFSDRVFQAGIDVCTSGFHGHSAEAMDAITRKPHSFEKALEGFANIKSHGAELRITTVVCSLNYTRLRDVCAVAIENGVDHVNISAMQPGGTAENHLDGLLVRYADAYSFIKEAIEYSRGRGRTVTLEGFPHCALPGFEMHQVNWQRQTLKVMYRTMVIDDFNRFLNATMRAKGDKCRKCSVKDYCCGVYRGYIERYGWDEFTEYENTDEGSGKTG
jgi:MoaA/NifB/PqqE/SkfB family radical SAM enzyme